MRSKCINSTSGRKICHWKWIQRHRFPISQGNFSRPMLLFIYFDDFSLHMCSFDRITTSGLKSDVIFEFSVAIFQYAVVSGAQHRFRWLL